jgi:hypothetical protein
MAEKPIAQTTSAAYVYAILVDGVVRYIGKGRGPRAASHVSEAERINRRRAAGEKVRTSKFYNGLAAAIRAGRSVVSEIIAGDLTDEAAFARETEEIASYPAGQLWNLLPGGLGGDSGFFQEFWKDAANIDAASARAKAVWDRPGFRERACEDKKRSCNTPEFKALRSEEMRRRFSDPEYKRRHGELTKDRWERDRASLLEKIQAGKERAREKFSAATSAKWADPAYREKLCKAQSARWTPEARQRSAERMKAKYAADPALKQRIAEGVRKRWEDPAYRAKCERKAGKA